MIIGLPSPSSSAPGLRTFGCVLDISPGLGYLESPGPQGWDRKNLILQPAFQTRVHRESFPNSLISRVWCLKSLTRGKKTRVFSEKTVCGVQTGYDLWSAVKPGCLKHVCNACRQ